MKAYKRPETTVVLLRLQSSLLYRSPDPDLVIGPDEPNLPAGAPEYQGKSWDWDNEW